MYTYQSIGVHHSIYNWFFFAASQFHMPDTKIECRAPSLSCRMVVRKLFKLHNINTKIIRNSNFKGVEEKVQPDIFWVDSWKLNGSEKKEENVNAHNWKWVSENTLEQLPTWRGWSLMYLMGKGALLTVCLRVKVSGEESFFRQL